MNNLKAHYPNVLCYLAIKKAFRHIFSTFCTSAHKLDLEATSEAKEDGLYKYLSAKIKSTGPITVAEYMKECLTNSRYGYYMKGDVFGKAGDFTTSPEISQLFGEMIGVWFLNEWKKVGSPKPFQFIELGPGRGTMMADIIRVFTQLGASRNMSVKLVEASEQLSNIQADNLCFSPAVDSMQEDHYKSGRTQHNVPINWYKELQDIKSPAFSMVVAHEFFDALPIHKFQRTEEGWREILIDVDPERENRFKYVLARSHTPMSQLIISDYKGRDHVELSMESITVIRNLAARLKVKGGITLVIDYGHRGDKTDTFRAFKKHEQCDPLENPGEVDLTADVDFSSLKLAVKDVLVTCGPITQREFLFNMQIQARLEKLLKSCEDEKDKDTLTSAFKMITDKEQMGGSYSFMALFPSVLKDHLAKYPVAGF